MMVYDYLPPSLPLSRSQTSQIPLLFDPGWVAKRRFVSRRIVSRQIDLRHHLANEGCLADLTWPSQDLDELAFLAQAGE